MWLRRGIWLIGCLLLVLVSASSVTARIWIPVYVITDAASVRECPSMECAVKYVAAWGDALLLIDDVEYGDAPWIHVKTSDPLTSGWVHESVVRSENPQGWWRCEEIEFTYSRMVDSCAVTLVSPVSPDTEVLAPLFSSVIGRVFGDDTNQELWLAALADSSSETCVDTEAARYCFEFAPVDTQGIVSLRAQRESK